RHWSGSGIRLADRAAAFETHGLPVLPGLPEERRQAEPGSVEALGPPASAKVQLPEQVGPDGHLALDADSAVVFGLFRFDDLRACRAGPEDAVPTIRGQDELLHIASVVRQRL